MTFIILGCTLLENLKSWQILTTIPIDLSDSCQTFVNSLEFDYKGLNREKGRGVGSGMSGPSIPFDSFPFSTFPFHSFFFFFFYFPSRTQRKPSLSSDKTTGKPFHVQTFYQLRLGPLLPNGGAWECHCFLSWPPDMGCFNRGQRPTAHTHTHTIIEKRTLPKCFIFCYL